MTVEAPGLNVVADLGVGVSKSRRGNSLEAEVAGLGFGLTRLALKSQPPWALGLEDIVRTMPRQRGPSLSFWMGRVLQTTGELPVSVDFWKKAAFGFDPQTTLR